MVPIDATFWSNTKGACVRLRIYELHHNISICNESINLLEKLTTDKLIRTNTRDKIKISRTDQLKFLEAISEDIEEKYFNVTNSLIYIESKKRIQIFKWVF